MDETGAIPERATDDPERSFTRPGGVPGQSIQDRVVGLEYEIRMIERQRRERELAIDARLREGAESFGDLRKAVAPKPLSMIQVLPAAVAIVLALLSFAWAAGRYPDRKEFDAKLNSTQADVSAMRVELTRIAAQWDMAATIRTILREKQP